MDVYVYIALLLAVISSVVGWVLISNGKANKLSSLVFGIFILIFITCALMKRGELRGACPLSDAGEVFLFISWSLSIFYVFTGGAYRLSLLGLFTSPAIGILLVLVLTPGMLTENPVKAEVLDPWKESHAATSVLSYGALGLAALASVMFLVLDKKLKAQTSDSFYGKMPPVRTLVTSVYRLLLVGVTVLTLGIVAGFMSHEKSGLVHLLVAGGVWLAYIILLTFYFWRGLSPRRLSWCAVLLFICSCGIFFII